MPCARQECVPRRTSAPALLPQPAQPPQVIQLSLCAPAQQLLMQNKKHAILTPGQGGEGTALHYTALTPPFRRALGCLALTHHREEFFCSHWDLARNNTHFETHDGDKGSICNSDMPVFTMQRKPPLTMVTRWPRALQQVGVRRGDDVAATLPGKKVFLSHSKCRQDT